MDLDKPYLECIYKAHYLPSTMPVAWSRELLIELSSSDYCAVE